MSLLRVWRPRAQEDVDTTGVSGCGREDLHRPPIRRGCGTVACIPGAEDTATQGRGGLLALGLPSDRSGEQGPRGGGPAEDRACAVWLGMAGYFKQHTGEICVTLEMGWMRASAAAEHLCSARGLCRVWAGAGNRRDQSWGSVRGGGGGDGCRGGQIHRPCSEREPPPQGMLGSLSQPLPSMTRRCAEAVMGVCEPFTSLVLDTYSL